MDVTLYTALSLILHSPNMNKVIKGRLSVETKSHDRQLAKNQVFHAINSYSVTVLLI